jgi:hypothetical protein
MDFNTLRVASLLQNEDLEAIQSLHRMKRYFFGLKYRFKGSKSSVSTDTVACVG